MPKLANPTWLSATLAYVRDLDQYSERARRLVKGSSPAPATDPLEDPKGSTRAARKAAAAQRRKEEEAGRAAGQTGGPKGGKGKGKEEA